MYEVVSILFPAVYVFIQGYCLQYFYGSFLDSRIKSRMSGVYVAALYGISRLISIWVIPWKYDDYELSAAKEAMFICILGTLAICFYKAFRVITVFLVVTFQALSDISSYVAVILIDKLENKMIHVWNWCMEERIITSEKTFDIVVKTGVVGVLFLQYLIILLLLYLSLRKIVGDFREKDYNISRTELLFILTPAAVSLMICMLLRVIMITVEDSIPKMLYDKYPMLTVLLPAILLLSLLSILYGVKLFQDMIYWNREKSSRIILEKQVVSLQEHMEEMERIYSGIRGMKHDMKNSLSVIQRLSAGNGTKENEELKAYLSELNQNLEKLEIRFKTGNTVVDTLLNMKYHEAVRDVLGLKMDADKLMFPQGLEIHSYDIGVILGNALDNAIEACRRLKAKEADADAFIRLSSLQKGNLLILKVENSFDGRLVQKGQEEFPVTDKADKNSHGIGLANIKSTAEKYQGTMDFKVKDGVFILSVMMKAKGDITHQ